MERTAATSRVCISSLKLRRLSPEELKSRVDAERRKERAEISAKAGRENGEEAGLNSTGHRTHPCLRPSQPTLTHSLRKRCASIAEDMTLGPEYDAHDPPTLSIGPSGKSLGAFQHSERIRRMRRPSTTSRFRLHPVVSRCASRSPAANQAAGRETAVPPN